MTDASWLVKGQDLFEFEGPLDRETVPKLWKELQSIQWQGECVEVSLGKLGRVDSAGMVMLIHLIENAKKQNCHIMLSFVPDELRTLFQLSNVDEWIAEHLKNTTGVNCG
ncbi:STAS domain-containing protein [Vibrio aquaticus]|uniref:STAS domain-containing protein n=1 Tax=Vibrio aquaticus TaxID=2496559 RepID=A0A432CX32_9VIBR|nr:lipid asymmetry maintenance protein MlaB [Vibrio aquaticus]RTZ14886.1 STAS domain-containing protein [Vibrio aquaticus]